MAQQSKDIGRLAFRTEGEFVNAYYALRGSMEGALLLFSVNRSAAAHPIVRERILDLGRAIVGQLLHEATGQRVEFLEPIPAPEHEKAGHA